MDVKTTLLDLPIDLEYPRSVSELRWMKEDSSGGRKDRGIELGVEISVGMIVMTAVGEEMEHEEHSELSLKENTLFIKKNIRSSLTFVPFIG